MIVYKKKNRRVILRMTRSDTTSNNEWQPVRTSGTKNTTSDNEIYHEWQRMTRSDNEWEQAKQSHFKDTIIQIME